MNEKLKPLLQLIALACGLIFIVLIAASFVISSTEEIDLTRTPPNAMWTLFPFILAFLLALILFSGVVEIIYRFRKVEQPIRKTEFVFKEDSERK